MPMEPMICSQCGAQVDPGSGVCKYCGTVFSVEKAGNVTNVMGSSDTIEIAGIRLPVAQGTEILNELKIGSKVKAIKLLREATGMGLKEAKDAIDLYVSGNGGDYPADAQQSGGCYIATCVYGSYDCPQVWTLRRFRDETLDSTWYGKLFIRCYYAISPVMVKWFGKQNWFRVFWKNRLDGMISRLNNRGVENTPYHDKY